MKKFTIFFSLLAFIIANSMGFAQQTKKVLPNKGLIEPIDTRVDNMRYWMKKAEAGIIPFNPQVVIPPAIYKGNQIMTKGVKTENSPDVPVTNLTNVTESENSVFIDPNNADYILNSNNSTPNPVSGIYGANYFQSANSGQTWGGSYQGAGGSNSGDPTTAIGLTGRQYVGFIDNNDGQSVAWSTDGNTWTPAVAATQNGDLLDKNHMWIDNRPTSPYEGNIYVAYTDFGSTGYPIEITRSVDDGLTYSTPVNISTAINAGSHNQGVNIQTGPNGEVYVAWAVYDGWPTDETAIGFAKSTDGGVSYQTASRIISNIKGIRTTAVSKNHRVNSFPVMAADISGGAYNGNIYIVWTNVGTPGTNTGTNKSVYIIRSSNGGNTWSTPVRVNQGPNVDGKEAYFPWISCDPETGVLSVVFYDDRNVSSTECEVFSAYSTDAGNTWTDFQVSDVAFTPAAIPGLAGGYMGDYLGITSKGGKVYPCWTDNRGGLYMTYVSPYQLGLNAGFSANSTTICTGSTVTFLSTSTGPPTSWTWSFPGGTPSSFSGQNPPPITYSVTGIYDVSLTVSDGTTTDTETKTGYITVKNLIANFTGTPTIVVIGNTVTFTDNSSCSPTAWNWSFPGGTPSSFTGQSPPAITYSTVGTYDVVLIVTKPGGTDTKTRTNYITVTPPIFNMTNGTITTCTGDFYDSGGSTGNYQNNENFTETFYPSTPGYLMQFTFTSFTTESGYDYLRIYNGTSTTAPLIGTYHGTVGPGTVTATNVAGALTFNFTSDPSVVYAGWSAAIACQNPNINANFSANNTTVCVGAPVTFTNLSTGSPTSWTWSFPDGTPSSFSGQNPPPINYYTGGTYNVSLTVSDGTNSDTETKTGYITVNPLVADFSGAVTTICAGNTVTFASNSLCNPTSLTWTFPGGTPSSYVGPTPPPITYSTAGTYDVSLTISNGTSSDTKTKTGYVIVNFLVADFTGTPTSVVIGNTVTFTDNSTCSPTTWNWSFPGGTPSTYTGQNPPPITYNTYGTYDVILTVTKPGGSNIKTKTGYITVTPTIFNMTNGTFTTCTGDFYDSGGPTGAYQNNENYTATFYPSTPGAMIRFVFSSFNTESGYDYLRIYNGTSIAAPLIGTYNGTIGPGTVMASNTSGALTFKFTSDGSVTPAGWAATINCQSITLPPVADFVASSLTPGINSTVTFTDLSSNIPTSWLWNFTPGSVVYMNGTNANFQNPQVQFTVIGPYTVSLTATNANGSDNETKTNYINTTVCSPCASTSNDASMEWISNVTFNTINNTSAGGTGYQDFTSISTSVNLGSIYSLSISCGQISTYNEHAWAFIDWNKDCDFTDTGESYDLGEVSGPGTVTLNVTVPSDALAGSTRMRTSLKYYSDPTSCETFSNGQVEDYTLIVQGSSKNLTLKVYLEGLYNGAGTMRQASDATGPHFGTGIADQVTVELHSSANYGTIVNSFPNVNLSTSGDIVMNGITTIPNGSYYITIRHRNSIETTTAAPVSFTGATITYDFSTAASQAHGNNLLNINGVFVIYAGDANQDGIVNPGDILLIESAANGMATGYIATDINGDGLIDLTDMVPVDFNADHSITTSHP